MTLKPQGFPARRPPCQAESAEVKSTLLPSPPCWHYFRPSLTPRPPGPRVSITTAQASNFFSAFTTLTQQAHVALVAEDQPLHMTLTPQQAAALKLNPDGEPLSTLLPRLAAAYDYDVQTAGPVFLLEKRYTDVADLPSVTVQECVLALDETNRYAENFNPHLPLGLPDRSPVISDLIYSLTPEQLAAMKDIHRGLLVASLAPVHQHQVWQFLLHMYVQTSIEGLPRTISALTRTAAMDPRFSWRNGTLLISPKFARFFTGFDTPLFGYDATPFRREAHLHHDEQARSDQSRT